MEATLQELKQRLHEANDISHAAAVLHWDQATYMPPAGAEARGRQLALLSRIAHEKYTDPAIGHLLDALLPYEESLSYDSDDASLLRITRRMFERQVKVPSSFVETFGNHLCASRAAWTQARPENNFALVAPLLEKTVEYSRQYANYFPGYQHIADPLIDAADYDVKTEQLQSLFSALRINLVPMAHAITSQPVADSDDLQQFFSEEQQCAFAREVVTKFGYDFQRGRLDKTPHPFMTTFSLDDVRITTRFNEHDLNEALFSIFHEAGHAIYEQGIDRSFEGSLLAEGASSGVHESQSRLWENLVGRSRACWTYWYPRIQAQFPEQLNHVSFDKFYRVINKVSRSLIRTDADEVTYNLHVMIRFDLELALLEGNLAVRDLPDVWRARYSEDLGITPPDDRNGVLQDVHWYDGPVGGAFQCYTLGNILSAQFFAGAVQAFPSIPGEIARGDYHTLYTWLHENIYQHGCKFTMNELLTRITGESLTIEPYLAYLRHKFGELYQLS